MSKPLVPPGLAPSTPAIIPHAEAEVIFPPIIVMFFKAILLLPGPVVTVLANQILQVPVPVLPFVRVRLAPPEFKPSMVTYLAFSSLKTATDDEPLVTEAATPAAGLIVNVAVALASGLFRIAKGKVSVG